MIKPIEWFKNHGFSFDDKITIKDVIDLQTDAYNQALTDAAAKVKALPCGLDCACDFCVARGNDVSIILELRVAALPNGKKLSHREDKP